MEGLDRIGLERHGLDVIREITPRPEIMDVAADALRERIHIRRRRQPVLNIKGNRS
jgi:hypothetical protein